MQCRGTERRKVYFSVRMVSLKDEKGREGGRREDGRSWGPRSSELRVPYRVRSLNRCRDED